MSPWTKAMSVGFKRRESGDEIVSGAGTIRHEGSRAPPLWEMARHGGTEGASLEISHTSG